MNKTLPFLVKDILLLSFQGMVAEKIPSVSKWICSSRQSFLLLLFHGLVACLKTQHDWLNKRKYCFRAMKFIFFFFLFFWEKRNLMEAELTSWNTLLTILLKLNYMWIMKNNHPYIEIYRKIPFNVYYYAITSVHYFSGWINICRICQIWVCLKGRKRITC